MLLAISFMLIFCSLLMIISQFMPVLLDRIYRSQHKKVNETEKQLDKMFIEVKKEKLFFLYTLLPIIVGVVVFALLHNLFISLIAVILSLILPKIVIKNLDARRKSRFQSQLVDTLNVLNSALKGGLSLLQAFEVIVEDMPAPMNQEIGLVVRENKIGIPIEESLKHLNQRMNLEELSLVINAILVSRETGGDLTKVLSRLSVTIRDNRKLRDQVNTLTLQGKLQGIIMSFLPIVFVWWVVVFNREHFDIMLRTDIGRTLIVVAIVLQLIGMVLIRHFSLIKI